MDDGRSGDQKRQFVNFSFFRIAPEWRGLPKEEREWQKGEALDTLKRWCNPDMRMLTYSMVGLRSDCQMMLWRICYSLDCLSSAHADFMHTRLGSYLQVAHSYLSMTRRSVYLIDQEHHKFFDPKGVIRPGAGKYLFVVPLVKTRSWYQLPLEERQRMINEQIEVGDEFRNVRLHVMYSFGIDAQDLMLAYETDRPEQMLDLAMRMRETDAASYTESEGPVFTCLQTSPQEMLERLG
ncbi:MAG TPA: chlorite dismutase family protein [Terriglobales bacterium]|nr:chlorite dismutase family protein [Terriglobales bacterium]